MTEKQLAAALKVQFTPTLLFLDEKGGVALRVNGYLPPERFESALDYVSGRMEGKVSFANFGPAGTGEREAQSAGLLHEAALRPAPQARRASRWRCCSRRRTAPAATSCTARASSARRCWAAWRSSTWCAFQPCEDASLMAPGGQPVRASEWAAALKLTYVPAMVFFDDRGREVFRIEAYMRPFHLAGSLEYVASGGYRASRRSSASCRPKPTGARARRSRRPLEVEARSVSGPPISPGA